MDDTHHGTSPSNRREENLELSVDVSYQLILTQIQIQPYKAHLTKKILLLILTQLWKMNEQWVNRSECAFLAYKFSLLR